MTPTPDLQKDDPVGFLLIMVMGFVGIACPISLIVIDDPRLSVVVASVLGIAFVGIALLLYLLGRVRKNDRKVPPAQASLALVFMWALCTVVSAILTIVFASSLKLLPASSFALGSLGFFAYARSNYVTFRARITANQSSQPSRAFGPRG